MWIAIAITIFKKNTVEQGHWPTNREDGVTAAPLEFGPDIFWAEAKIGAKPYTKRKEFFKNILKIKSLVPESRNEVEMRELFCEFWG